MEINRERERVCDAVRERSIVKYSEARCSKWNQLHIHSYLYLGFSKNRCCVTYVCTFAMRARARLATLSRDGGRTCDLHPQYHCSALHRSLTLTFLLNWKLNCMHCALYNVVDESLFILLTLIIDCLTVVLKLWRLHCRKPSSVLKQHSDFNKHSF